LSQDPSVAFMHLGLCVSDVEASTRFYVQALGFRLERSLEILPPFHELIELPTIKAKARFLRLGGMMLELMEYEEPGFIGPAERRPMNQLGYTHITLVVDDLAAVSSRIEAYGGAVQSERKLSHAMGDFVFANDPDGARLELWQKPAGA
jgi:catechol 2,3-dioxygenase-like lactoylglutathione lyase family enzyme